LRGNMAERKDRLIGNGNGSVPSHGSETLSQALRMPAMRDVFEHETPLNYAESLTQLEVPPEDVERNTIQLVVKGPLRRKQVEVVYASQRAAFRNGNHRDKDNH